METLKGKEIKDILSKKQETIKTKTFIAIFQKNNLGKPRFAFIASKKLSKKAVDRNRAKRLLRESVRMFYPQIQHLGYDIILIARKYIIGKKIHQVLKDIETLLKNLRERNEKVTDMAD
jgi:ribonuclease P protein component